MIIEELPDWAVLLIGGPSSVGKSTAAKEIGRRFGVPWLQVDDLRLALQECRVSLPDPKDTAKLYFFDETPNVWQLPPERLRDGFVGIGEVLAPAIAKVITNHVAIAEPIVLEGDGLLPSLLTRSEVRHWGSGGRVRAIFVVPPDEGTIVAAMQARGWGLPARSATELKANAHAKWLYGQWLAAEARCADIPVVASHPWATSADRILIARRTIS